MWPGLVAAAKEGGCNTIETYVFWNGHELSPGNYYFEDRFDLVKFAKIVRDAGLYMILRIGPFVAAEYNFGGIPVWLHYVSGTVFRTNSEPFKMHMQNFTMYIVNMMKQEKLFASQGGHIILAQSIYLISRHAPLCHLLLQSKSLAFILLIRAQGAGGDGTRQGGGGNSGCLRLCCRVRRRRCARKENEIRAVDVAVAAWWCGSCAGSSRSRAPGCALKEEGGCDWS